MKICILYNFKTIPASQRLQHCSRATNNTRIVFSTFRLFSTSQTNRQNLIFSTIRVNRIRRIILYKSKQLLSSTTRTYSTLYVYACAYTYIHIKAFEVRRRRVVDSSYYYADSVQNGRQGYTNLRTFVLRVLSMYRLNYFPLPISVLFFTKCFL